MVRRLPPRPFGGCASAPAHRRLLSGGRAEKGELRERPAASWCCGRAGASAALRRAARRRRRCLLGLRCLALPRRRASPRLAVL
eukprot:3859313-Alexandrium_andersonii.AAC.1